VANNISDGAGEKAFAERTVGIDGKLWQVIFASLLAGGIGGFGFRQVDSTAFTASEGAILRSDIEALERNDRIQDIKLGQLPPAHLLLQVGSLEFRVSQLEKEHKTYKNKAPSGGR
jgi:hypothetical protein